MTLRGKTTLVTGAAGEGVTSNAVAPAYVMTRMIADQLSEAQRQTQLAAIPVGRSCELEDVAQAVMFLASPLAGFITGEVVDLNGGLHFDGRVRDLRGLPLHDGHELACQSFGVRLSAHGQPGAQRNCRA